MAGNSYASDFGILLRSSAQKSENPSIFVKVTAKKISGTFLCGHSVYTAVNSCGHSNKTDAKQLPALYCW